MAGKLEEYLESVASLPTELRRQFQLLRELDKCSFAQLSALEIKQNEFLQHVKAAVKDKPRTAGSDLRSQAEDPKKLAELTALRKLITQCSEEKVHVAQRVVDDVSGHIDRLQALVLDYRTELMRRGDWKDDEEVADLLGGVLPQADMPGMGPAYGHQASFGQASYGVPAASMGRQASAASSIAGRAIGGGYAAAAVGQGAGYAVQQRGHAAAAQLALHHQHRQDAGAAAIAAGAAHAPVPVTSAAVSTTAAAPPAQQYAGASAATAAAAMHQATAPGMAVPTVYSQGADLVPTQQINHQPGAYCYCRLDKPAEQMIGCDMESASGGSMCCETAGGWFHLLCVGLRSSPDDDHSWVCADCWKKLKEASLPIVRHIRADGGKRGCGVVENKYLPSKP